MKPVIEITLDQLKTDYDWMNVFEFSGQCDACPPAALISTETPKRENVVEIIAACNGYNDGPEWIGVFLLNDGRYVFASGWCDYTGWDCQGGNHLEVASNLEDILKIGLNKEQRERLGL